MERVDGPQTPYEVYCYRCQASFAVGTRSCVHCGARLGKDRITRAAPSIQDVEIGDEELPPRRGRFSPIAMLWIALALGGALYRACAGPGSGP